MAYAIAIFVGLVLGAASGGGFGLLAGACSAGSSYG